jgi:hypothetical protein
MTRLGTLNNRRERLIEINLKLRSSEAGDQFQIKSNLIQSLFAQISTERSEIQNRLFTEHKSSPESKWLNASKGLTGAQILMYNV